MKTLIKPVGFFNLKYKRLMNVLYYIAEKGLDNPKFYNAPIDELRQELLDINGVGPETADSILLYAFERPTFVVDAYTRRLFSRLGYGWMENSSYDEIQRYFMDRLDGDSRLYNEYHALIVMHSKLMCKKNPFCWDCALTCPMKSDR